MRHFLLSRYFLLFLIAVGVALALLLAILFVTIFPVSLTNAIYVGGGVAGAPLIVAEFLAVRYRRRYLRAHDYCVCLKCGYPLTTIGEVGNCSECGTEFKAANVRRYWQEVIW